MFLASIKTIGENAFENNKALTSISLPNTLITISRNAFNSCKGLESISLPDSVTAIGIRAFETCSKLESVTIGVGVQEIGKNALSGCTALTTIIYNGTAAQWDSVIKGKSSAYPENEWSIGTSVSVTCLGDKVEE